MTAEEISYINRRNSNGIIWAVICAISAIGLLLAIIWYGSASTALILLLGLLSLCALIMVLKYNAEALHRQTNEDIAFIHLTTSLFIGLALLCPVIGAWFTLKIALMALQGKCAQSGGTLKTSPPPHAIGRTSFHLGILLLVLTAAAQGGWLVILLRVYSALQG